MVPFQPTVPDVARTVSFLSAIACDTVIAALCRYSPRSQQLYREELAAYQQIKSMLPEGRTLVGLAERRAVYGPLMEGSATNFFDVDMSNGVLKDLGYSTLTAELESAGRSIPSLTADRLMHLVSASKWDLRQIGLLKGERLLGYTYSELRARIEAVKFTDGIL